MENFKIAVLCGAMVLGLAACGDSFEEQALIGAGAGVATAAVLDGSLLAGAVVGGAANVIYCKENPSKC